jgi:thiol:disulfide interchange protein/DsbC/DsbD-like thiol-disulfide interchange protein
MSFCYRLGMLDYRFFGMRQWLLTGWILLAAASAQAAERGLVRRDHLSVELISAQTSVPPGATITAGLRLVHDPQWHTYWLNPGDSGLPTKLDWTLPDGAKAAGIDWPAPHRIELDPLTNFGYDGEIVLPVQVSLPANATPGSRIPIEVKATWLVCKEECIPGDAVLATDIEIGNTSIADPRWQMLFEAARASQPAHQRWPARWADGGQRIDVIVDDGGALADPATVELFPHSPSLIAHGRGEVERLPDGTLRIRTAKSDSFNGSVDASDFLLTSGHGHERRAFSFTAQPATAPLASHAAEHAVAITTDAGTQPTVVLALLLAFFGGVLLNLMPCVLPVLSLKALAIAEHSHDRVRARQHGLLYLAGTLACFVALASVLLVLRAAGEALGWGFQLQTPWVVAALAMLMTVMGLSLSGVFELGSSWMGMGQSLTEGGNARGAFFSGALAAVVASPCTAPFMGPALGFAVTQPAPIALSIFVLLACGLALPIVALSFAPALARWLPRPGAWMVRFKQILAYPLYLTAVWLLWVLGRQLGADGMALSLLGMIALVFGLWLWSSSAARLIPRTVAALALLAAVLSLISLRATPELSASADSSAHGAQPWSAEHLDTLRAEGKPVLVNMTAAWCITCLANERVALSVDSVQARLRDLEVAYLKGDWTHRDASITSYLAQFGRNGVPLYVLYPAGSGQPEVLPQLLTPSIVEEALHRAVAARDRPKSPS